MYTILWLFIKEISIALLSMIDWKFVFERLFARILVHYGRKLVNSTTNKLDNKFLDDIISQLESNGITIKDD